MGVMSQEAFEAASRREREVSRLRGLDVDAAKALVLSLVLRRMDAAVSGLDALTSAVEALVRAESGQ